MNDARVLTAEDLAHRLRIRTVAGFVAGVLFAAGAEVARAYYFPPRVFVGVPEVVRATESETIVRIPTRQGAYTVDCTLSIDHKRRGFSMAC